MYLTSLLYDGIFMRKFYLFLLRPYARAAVALPLSRATKEAKRPFWGATGIPRAYTNIRIRIQPLRVVRTGQRFAYLV